MANFLQSLKPPEIVRGVTTLNRDLFEKPLKICYLHLKGLKLSKVLPVVKKYFLKLENFKPIQTVGENEVRIYLNPEQIDGWSSLPEETSNALGNLSVLECDMKRTEHTLKYENYSAEAVLKAVLPQNNEGMSSFTKIGHIVHVNLREHLLPYKNIIGKVLFDKVHGCRTVVNKIDMIDNTYRNFQMEILEGTDDMIATVKENRCSFQFDFSTVYWNSRLCTEHERIVKLLQPNDVLFDVFAGVGPFSIPAAKKKCIVYANDLNPESFKWLNFNSKANKIAQQNFNAYNKDGRDFIASVLKEFLPKHLNRQKIYITMNLPGLAVEFLSAFVKMFDEHEIGPVTNPPIVYVYCFAKGTDYTKIAKDLVVNHMGFDITDKIIEIFRVRTVSSMKEMMRIGFKLDRDILVGPKRRNKDEAKVLKKKCNAVMGKKKLNSVFKVAGAKSLKLKAKAKMVKSQLKNINKKIQQPRLPTFKKTETKQLDDEFMKLDDKIRFGVKHAINEQRQKEENKTVVSLASVDDGQFVDTDKKSEETAKSLDTMQL